MLSGAAQSEFRFQLVNNFQGFSSHPAGHGRFTGIMIHRHPPGLQHFARFFSHGHAATDMKER
jgi:hypothetical protein